MEISKSRLGQFFFLVGFVLLTAFFITDQTRNPDFCLFFWGGAAMALSGFLIWRDLKSPPQTDRFHSLRRFFHKLRERRSKNKKK